MVLVGQEIVYTSLITVYSVFWCVSVCLYIHRRNKEPVRTRSMLWSGVTGVGCLYAFVNQSIRIAFPSHISCAYRSVYAILSYVFVYLPALIRVEEIIFKYNWNREKLLGIEGWYYRHRPLISHRNQVVFFFLVLATHFIVGVAVAYGMDGGFPSVPMDDPRCSFRSQVTSQNALALVYVCWGFFGLFRLYGPTIQDAYRIKGELNFALWLITPGFILYAIFVIRPVTGFDHRSIPLYLNFIINVSTLIYPVYFSFVEEIERKKLEPAFQASGSSPNMPDVPLPLVSFQVNHSHTRRDSVLLTRLDDAVSIASQSAESLPFPTLPAASRRQSDATFNIRVLETDSPSCGSRRCSVAHPLAATKSFEYVLVHPLFLDAFVKFCVQSWCSETIAFYNQVSEMKLSEKRGKAHTAANIKAVLDDYIREGALRQINIPEDIQDSVIARVTEGCTSVDVFDAAFKHVYHSMKMDLYPRFCSSNLYIQALALEQSSC